MRSFSQPQPQTEPRILRLFISYASEDTVIAVAVAKGLREALGDVFGEVNMDKWFLQAGDVFKKELEAKLEKTDELVIVYTGTEKPSHSYPGWEVGYFEGVKRNYPDRKIVPLFLQKLPATAEDVQGVSLNIPRDQLQLAVEEFSTQNQVDEDDPMCRWIRDLQEKVQRIREEGHYPKAPLREEQDPVICVKKIRLAVFLHLKTTIETVLKPQKQITIKTTGVALGDGTDDLPTDAVLIPQGEGSPMRDIFGLSDAEMTWQKFLEQVSGDHKESWRQAITSVVTSSLTDSINVDNRQIILSHDELKTYRVILTTATRFYDDRREFNLYFVETYRQHEYGDEETTMLLKGLELVCRYRFMFLEDLSEFSSDNILATPIDRFPSTAAKLLRELNLTRKDTRNAGLDLPAVWKRFVDWKDIHDMAAAYGPSEDSIRGLVTKIMQAKDQRDALVQLREDLSKAVGMLENTTRPQNTHLIRAMAAKLRALVETNAATDH